MVRKFPAIQCNHPNVVLFHETIPLMKLKKNQNKYEIYIEKFPIRHKWKFVIITIYSIKYSARVYSM
jgi:hypothetical protein